MSRGGKRSPGRALLKGLVSAVCLAYFLTSAVVIINAFAWLPSMPSAWYQVQRLLYWPFKPYFALASALLGGSGIPYNMYAVLTWSPFLLAPVAAVLVLRSRGNPRRKGHSLAKGRLQPQ